MIYNWNLIRESFLNPYPILDESRDILLMRLRQILQIDDVLLDIGSSSRKLETRVAMENIKYIGADYPNWDNNYINALAPIQKRNPDAWVDVRKLGIRSNSVDIVTCIDVLEHIDDPEAAFVDMANTLKEMEYLFILVPFFMEIHGGNHGEDDFYRYTKSSLISLCARVGITVTRAEYIGKFGTTLNTLISGFTIRQYQLSHSIAAKTIWLIIAAIVIPITLLLRTIIDRVDTTHRNPSYIMVIGRKSHSIKGTQ